MTQRSQEFEKLRGQCELLRQHKLLLRRKAELEEQLPQARFSAREADAALTEYECGGFRPWLDKLSGKWEEKQEELRRSASSARRTLESLTEDLARIGDALKASQVSSHEEIYHGAMNLAPQERELVCHALASVLAGELADALKQAQEALMEAQQWARPNNRIDTAPGYTKGILLAKAEGCAASCREGLEKLNSWGIRLTVHPYFQNPSGYIHGVASPYGELDRINSAMAAIRQTENQIQELFLQLSEVELS